MYAPETLTVHHPSTAAQPFMSFNVKDTPESPVMLEDAETESICLDPAPMPNNPNQELEMTLPLVAPDLAQDQ